LILFFGCNSRPYRDTLTGDLYFSFLDWGAFYNQPDSVIKKFETYFDKFGAGRLIKQYRLLKHKNLLYRPFVYLKVQKDSVITVFMSTAGEVLYINVGEYLLNMMTKKTIIRKVIG